MGRTARPSQNENRNKPDHLRPPPSIETPPKPGSTNKTNRINVCKSTFSLGLFFFEQLA
jgi:hypothetical protein